MKEQIKVIMNALKGRVSNDLDDLVNRTDSPFTTSVNTFPLPQKFRMPQIESYDGVKDPLDHLETFKTLMHLQGVPDEIMCRAFPTTLTCPARIWFNQHFQGAEHPVRLTLKEDIGTRDLRRA